MHTPNEILLSTAALPFICCYEMNAKKLMMQMTIDGVQIIIIPKTTALNFDCNRQKNNHCGYAGRKDLTKELCSCTRGKKTTIGLSRLRLIQDSSEP